jgi:hypothetical protein
MPVTIPAPPIEVKEFRKGTVKPFVSSSMGGAGIVTGICK